MFWGEPLLYNKLLMWLLCYEMKNTSDWISFIQLNQLIGIMNKKAIVQRSSVFFRVLQTYLGSIE